MRRRRLAQNGDSRESLNIERFNPSVIGMARPRPGLRRHPLVLPREGRNEKLLDLAGLANQRPRVALYSHDTVGLGHMRRNMLIAQTLLSSTLKPTILMLAGAREAGAFSLPPGVDCLTLPALKKGNDGEYVSRSLDLARDDLVALRARTLRAALEAFGPDVLIVDKVPRGVLRELDPALVSLRKRGRTRCVLGLRDVLDDAETVRREWAEQASDKAIRDFYDAVWVYGDPTVFDQVREYGFSTDVAAKVRYTGYFDRRMRLGGQVGNGNEPEASDLPCGEGSQCLAARGERCVTCPASTPHMALGLPPGDLALCLVGGGQDGAQLAEAFVDADLPPETNGVVVTGPFMPPEAQAHLKCRMADQPRLRVLKFVTEPALLLSRADHVVCMSGYNTVWEVLSFERRALIVPRVRPRSEQLIRAERLRDLGLLDVLHPDRLSPKALSDWLAHRPGDPPHPGERVDLNGLTRLPSFLADVLAPPSMAVERPAHVERAGSAA